MKTFAVITLGCKVNQYESQQVRQLLEQLGLTLVDSDRSPDLIAVNTCCVTSIAAAKCRQQIRKVRRINPNSPIIVFGCLTAISTSDLNNLCENIYVATDREHLTALLTQISHGQNTLLNTFGPSDNIKPNLSPKIKSKNKLSNLPELSELTAFLGHTRAFLKIQDGCDAHCTYCIIPKTRPLVHSKTPESVLKEAKNLVKAGHKEIVLTGIFLGAFGQKTTRRKFWDENQKNALPNLLDKLAQIPNLARIRLSSLEPADVTEQLLDAFVRHPNIMPHLHLSLQSGSDNVLKKMARQYSAADFLEKVDMIKSRLDRPAITADIIVGFPGESDDDFNATVELAKKVGFAKMHVFPFSARDGTPAAKLPNHIPKIIKKQRAAILHDLDIALGRKFRDQFIGQTATVLLENDDEKITGRAERYFSVTIAPTNNNLKPNDLVTVKLIKNNDDGCIGQI